MAQKRSENTRTGARNTTKSIDAINLEFGKMPPQAVDIEEAVLGAIMLEKDAIIEVLDILTTESFYKEEHQKIFQAILNLSSNDKAIDILTVTEELRALKTLDGVGTGE